MTEEQKIREIYPLIPKTEKTLGQRTIVYAIDLKTICIFESVKNLELTKNNYIYFTEI